MGLFSFGKNKDSEKKLGGAGLFGLLEAMTTAEFKATEKVAQMPDIAREVLMEFYEQALKERPDDAKAYEVMFPNGRAENDLVLAANFFLTFLQDIVKEGSLPEVKYAEHIDNIEMSARGNTQFQKQAIARIYVDFRVQAISSMKNALTKRGQATPALFAELDNVIPRLNRYTCIENQEDVPATRKRQAENVFLNEDEVASLTGEHINNVKRWVVFGGGPRYLKLGKTIRYNAADVKEFMEQKAAASAPNLTRVTKHSEQKPRVELDESIDPDGKQTAAIEKNLMMFFEKIMATDDEETHRLVSPLFPNGKPSEEVKGIAILVTTLNMAIALQGAAIDEEITTAIASEVVTLAEQSKYPKQFAFFYRIYSAQLMLSTHEAIKTLKSDAEVKKLTKSLEQFRNGSVAYVEEKLGSVELPESDHQPIAFDADFESKLAPMAKVNLTEFINHVKTDDSDLFNEMKAAFPNSEITQDAHAIAIKTCALIMPILMGKLPTDARISAHFVSMFEVVNKASSLHDQIALTSIIFHYPQYYIASSMAAAKHLSESESDKAKVLEALKGMIRRINDIRVATANAVLKNNEQEAPQQETSIEDMLSLMEQLNSSLEKSRKS